MNIKIIAAIVVVISIFLYFQKTLKGNLIVFLTVARGILTQNCNWWKISDMILTDTSGVNFYNDIKQYSKVYPINIFGKQIYIE